MTYINSKRSITALIVLLLSLSLLNSTISLPNSIWSITEVISTESTSNSQYPNLAIDSKNNVHVTWTDSTDLSSGTDQDIFYKFWNDKSQSWGTTEVVSTESSSDSYTSSHGIDGQGTVHVVWTDWTNYLSSGIDTDIFYKYRNATTQSWSTTEVVSVGFSGSSSDPRLAIDNKDNVHVVWGDSTNYLSSGTDRDIFYKLWNSTSQSWSTTEVVSTESSLVTSKPSVAIDSKDNIHVSWQDLTYLDPGMESEIFYKYRDATSQSWSTAEVVTTESTLLSYRPSLDIDSQGNVHVAWYISTDHMPEIDDDIFYNYKNATLGSWSTAEELSTESTGKSQYPSLTVDSQDNVQVMWHDATDYLDSGPDSDIFYKFWNATSQIWSTTEVVSPESTWNSLEPNMDIDNKDNLYVAWFDQSDYLGATDNDYDIFYKIKVNVDSLSQTVTNTETETETDTETETETNTETETDTETETETETETVFGSETLYETSTQIILTTSVITNAKSEVSWSPFFLIPVLIVPLVRRNKKRR